MNTVIEIKKMQFTLAGDAVKITLSFNGEPDQDCTAQVENLETSTIKRIVEVSRFSTCIIREEGSAC